MTAPCPFCEPEFRAGVFYSAHGCVGAANIAPVSPGHSLVVPECHVSRLMSLSTQQYESLWRAVREVVGILLAVYEAPAVDISVQDGAAAGQTVDHVHVHVIPRRRGDLPAPGDWYAALIDSARRPQLTRQEVAAQAAFVRHRRAILGI